MIESDQGLENVSAVFEYPQELATGVFTCSGDLLLKSKEEGVLEFPHDHLQGALRELKEQPYIARVVTSNGIYQWGIFNRAFKGTGYHHFTGP